MLQRYFQVNWCTSRMTLMLSSVHKLCYVVMQINILANHRQALVMNTNKTKFLMFGLAHDVLQYIMHA